MKASIESYSDERLLDLLSCNDLVAFEEIYRRYWKRLYSICYKRVQSREIAEELVQDVFTSLWANHAKSSIVNLPCYLFAAVKYKVINHLAKEMSRKSYSAEKSAAMVNRDNSTEETVFLDDLNSALEKEIRKLPAKRQRIFELHHRENLSVKQVATLLGISEKTVENQFGKAMKVLKVNLRHFTLFGVIGSNFVNVVDQIFI